MSGRHRLVSGELAEGKLRGKELADALAKGMLKDEKSASYEKKEKYVKPKKK